MLPTGFDNMMGGAGVYGFNPGHLYGGTPGGPRFRGGPRVVGPFSFPGQGGPGFPARWGQDYRPPNESLEKDAPRGPDADLETTPGKPARTWSAGTDVTRATGKPRMPSMFTPGMGGPAGAGAGWVGGSRRAQLLRSQPDVGAAYATDAQGNPVKVNPFTGIGPTSTATDGSMPANMQPGFQPTTGSTGGGMTNKQYMDLLLGQ